MPAMQPRRNDSTYVADFSVGFGSCLNPGTQPMQPAFAEVLQHRPNAFLFIGDINYMPGRSSHYARTRIQSTMQWRDIIAKYDMCRRSEHSWQRRPAMGSGTTTTMGPTTPIGHSPTGKRLWNCIGGTGRTRAGALPQTKGIFTSFKSPMSNSLCLTIAIIGIQTRQKTAKPFRPRPDRLAESVPEGEHSDVQSDRQRK